MSNRSRPARRRHVVTCASTALAGSLLACPSATAQVAVCGGPLAPNVAGSCFVPHPLEGCSDAACCNAVCAVDSFCCTVAWDKICCDEALAICLDDCQPDCDKLNIECLNPGPEYNNRTFVGRLDIVCAAGAGMSCTTGFPDGAGSCCTGWIAGKPDFIVTNAHCIFPNTQYSIEFNYECDDCFGGTIKQRTVVPLTVIFSDTDLDVAILRTTTGEDLTLAWGQAKIDPTPLAEDDEIYEIHHANCQPKGWDSGVVDMAYVPHPAICPGTIPEHKVTVIASPGASGSPVFRESNDCVSAICNCGPPCMPGFALPMDLVWPTLKAKILAAGGTVLECAGSSCPLSDHNCFTVGAPGCADVECCNEVCLFDGFCCDVAWDSLCVDQAAKACDGCGDPGAGDCCEPHDGPFCSDRTCCDIVCSFDPFCCEAGWDTVCADEAASTPECGCGKGCPPSDHNCFTVGGAGCADKACCNAVCELDPFCCDSSWDFACVGLAEKLCDGCGHPLAGDCCVAHDGPYCDDRTCCDLVCDIDPFCCDVEWDSVCAGEAAGFPECGCVIVVCPPSDHNCFTTGGPGCADVECCAAVCAIDPFCCETQWDGVCVNEASDLCEGCGDPAAGDCCAPHDGPYCADRTCCEIVCSVDPFCCKESWDVVCAAEAVDFPECGCVVPVCPLSDHNCFTTGGPGCADIECCVAVCLADGFCCDTAWDGLCVDQASKLCDGCGDPAAGDCCTTHDGPYCDNRTCCDLVCAIDAFCCQTAWDAICANEAGDFPECACELCPPSDQSCFEAHEEPGCEDTACCELVCALDAFCCEVEWDEICKDEANKFCGGCGVLDGGCCYDAHDGFGCNDATCCRIVCRIDPFCCEVAWDLLCADEALDFCCRGDLNRDGMVDAGDLGLLLDDWGLPGPADLNCDGVTDGADLGLLLRAWGPC